MLRLGWYTCALPTPGAWVHRHRYISSLPLPEMVFDDDAGLFNDYEVDDRSEGEMEGNSHGEIHGDEGKN